MVRIPSHRPPTHPGEMLLEEFLKPMGITQKELSKSIHVPYQRINEVINQKRGITPSTALRLERIRLDCVSVANHNLNRLLDKPGEVIE